VANAPEEKNSEKAAKKSAAPKAAAKKPAGKPKASGSRAKSGAPAVGPAATPRLLEKYRAEMVPVLMREFGYDNIMRVPQLKKVVVNIGLGEALTSSSALSAALGDLAIITGQKARENKARKSIAAFKLREGQTIGASVTLRGSRMWQFFDRLVNVTLPRVRDFRGVPRNAFDGRGNYTLGLTDQAVFPEIDYNQIDRLRGLQIVMVTSAETDEEGRRLMELLGVPYTRVDDPRLVGV
jgi:large subunit ribosomal protein L5